MSFHSYSQAGQDKFAYLVNGCRNSGTFLDVGCHDGRNHSNTLALEEIGWHGLCVDLLRQPGIEHRKCSVLIADALTADWEGILKKYFGEPVINYLSIDVDESSSKALDLITAQPYGFTAITVEHDAYRLGDGYRAIQRAILSKRGYKLIQPDVFIGPGTGVVGEGGAFEDWWVLER